MFFSNLPSMIAIMIKFVNGKKMNSDLECICVTRHIRKKNIALAMIDINFTDIGNELKVNTNEGIFDCKIVEKPFYDPKKKIVTT